MESLSVECKSAVHALFGWIRISVDSMLDYLDCDRERTDSTQQLKVLLGDLVCIARLREKTVSITMQEDTAIDLSFPSAAAYLKAIHNVMDNAIKYSNKVIDIRVTLKEHTLQTSIIDDGSLISPNTVNRLFSNTTIPHVRGDQSVDLKWDDSWGVGLSFSIKMLAVYQGYVSYSEGGEKRFDIVIPQKNLHSNLKQNKLLEEELRNSFFFDLHNIKNDLQKLMFFLPQDHYLSRVVHDIRDVFNSISPRSGNFKEVVFSVEGVDSNDNIPSIHCSETGIVIVDDDSINQLALTRMLTKLGLSKNNINCFTTPSDALTFLEHNNIDVILTDYHMPKLTGVDFARKAHENCKKRGKICPPIILISGDNIEPIPDLFAYFVVKPIEVNEIYSIFKKLNITLTTSFLEKPKISPKQSMDVEHTILQLQEMSMETGVDNTASACNLCKIY